MVGGWGTKKKKKKVRDMNLTKVDVPTCMTVCNIFTVILVSVCSLYNLQQGGALDW
jgi:hypothetical protein